jgi:hypothetical protein
VILHQSRCDIASAPCYPITASLARYRLLSASTHLARWPARPPLYLAFSPLLCSALTASARCGLLGLWDSYVACKRDFSWHCSRLSSPRRTFGDGGSSESLTAGRFDFASSSRSTRSSPDELLDLFLPIPPPLGSLQLVGSVSVLRAYELMRAHAFALLMRIVAQGI